MTGELRKTGGAPGYTLVEIMVAILIIFIVMGGVYRTISDETINMDRQERILDMQSNARAVLDRLTRDLRRAGFMGCRGTLSANTLSNAGPDNTWVRQFTLADNTLPGGRDWNGNISILEAFLAEAGGGMTGDYLGENLAVYGNVAAGHSIYKAETDVLTLVFLSDERNLDPATPMAASTDDPLTLAPAPALGAYAEGDILYIGDCEHFALFQKTADTDGNNYTLEHDATLLNTTADLGKTYGATAPAKLFKLNVVPYFIDGTNSLGQLSRGTQGDDIATNIEDLQVEFLFDTDADDDLGDEAWQDGFGTFTSKDVRAVRIWVLAMSSPDYGYTDNDTYDYPNSPYYTPDPNTTYRDAAGNLKQPNPYNSLNGPGGSPASQLPLANDGEYRYRYLASAVVYLRNGGLK